MNILTERLTKAGHNLPLPSLLRLLKILGLILLGWLITRAVILITNPEAAWSALPAIPAAASQSSGGTGQSFSFSTDPFTLNAPMGDSSASVNVIDLGLDVPETTLKLELTGRTVWGVGSAVLKTPDNQEKSYRVGEEVMNGVTLQRVASEYVVLDVRGELQRLTFSRENRTGLVGDDKAPIADSLAISSQREPVNQSNVSPQISASNIAASELLKTVKFNPYFDNGKLSGYSVSGNDGATSLKPFGLKPGDVITKVNNTSLVNDRLNLLELAASLKTASQVKMEIIRDGRPEIVEIGR